MANANYTFRTSYFKVTDENRYKELTQGFPKGVYQFDKDLDGQIFHGFGGYDSFEYYLPASECPVVTDAIEQGMKLFDCNGEPIAPESVDNEDMLYDENNEVFWGRNEDYDGGGFDWFVEELQKILTKDSVFICIEAGYENLRYIDAFVIIATAEQVFCKSLDDYIQDTLSKLPNVGSVSWQY